MKLEIEILETKYADANKLRDTIEELLIDKHIQFISIDVEE